MACISKLARGFVYDCDSGATGLQSAIIINKEDISSFTLGAPEAGGDTFVLGLTLVAGASAYRIDTPKSVLTMKETLKVNEGAPNAFTYEATLVTTPYIDVGPIGRLQGLSNGSFVIITKETSGVCRVYGLYYGLSSTNVERSSSDNGGWYTITMATPEQFIGEDLLGTSKSIYDTLYAAAVY